MDKLASHIFPKVFMCTLNIIMNCRKFLYYVIEYRLTEAQTLLNRKSQYVLKRGCHGCVSTFRPGFHLYLVTAAPSITLYLTVTSRCHRCGSGFLFSAFFFPARVDCCIKWFLTDHTQRRSVQDCTKRHTTRFIGCLPRMVYEIPGLVGRFILVKWADI